MNGFTLKISIDFITHELTNSQGPASSNKFYLHVCVSCSAIDLSLSQWSTMRP